MLPQAPDKWDTLGPAISDYIGGYAWTSEDLATPEATAAEMWPHYAAACAEGGHDPAFSEDDLADFIRRDAEYTLTE